MKLHLILLTAALSWGSLFSQKEGARQVIAGYLDLKVALVKGDVLLAREKAGALESTLQAGDGLAGDAKDPGILEEVRRIASAKKVEELRMLLGRLSEKLWASRYVDRDNSGITLHYFYCPMKKAYWISDTTAIKNPFYGQQMLACGKFEDTNNQ